MSSYKGHLAGGIFAYCLILFVVMQSLHPSFFTFIEWLGFCLLGSLFPDIDIKSKGQKIFYMLVMILMIYLVAIGHYDVLILVSLLAMLPLCTRHRGLFHNLWFLIGLSGALTWLLCTLWLPSCASILWYDFLFFIGGVISHLWLDLGLARALRW